MDFKVGKIEEINTVHHNDTVKRIVKLRIEEKQYAFFEFQGRNVEKLKGFMKGNQVKLYFEFNGKTSRLGAYYNNLIGKHIQLSN